MQRWRVWVCFGRGEIGEGEWIDQRFGLQLKLTGLAIKGIGGTSKRKLDLLRLEKEGSVDPTRLTPGSWIILETDALAFSEAPEKCKVLG